jgi:hypothetical protein
MAVSKESPLTDTVERNSLLTDCGGKELAAKQQDKNSSLASVTVEQLLQEDSDEEDSIDALSSLPNADATALGSAHCGVSDFVPSCVSTSVSRDAENSNKGCASIPTSVGIENTRSMTDLETNPVDNSADISLNTFDAIPLETHSNKSQEPSQIVPMDQKSKKSEDSQGNGPCAMLSEKSEVELINPQGPENIQDRPADLSQVVIENFSQKLNISKAERCPSTETSKSQLGQLQSSANSLADNCSDFPVVASGEIPIKQEAEKRPQTDVKSFITRIFDDSDDEDEDDDYAD